MSKVAIVTGASRGIGAAIARRLARDGIQVLVNYASRMDEADQVVRDITAAGGQACAVLADVSDSVAVEVLFDQAELTYGGVDILVNNAGVIFSEPFVNVMNPAGIMHDYGRFRASLTVNLDSVFIVTAAVVEHMVKRRTKGAIVNISSISACGNEGQTAYSAAKAGVNAMTVTWAKELGRWGIRSNAVAPGFIGTDSTRQALNETVLKHIQTSTPLRRLGRASEVAQAVIALIENDFINGTVLDVNGGLTI